jgi:TctA family transporter
MMTGDNHAHHEHGHHQHHAMAEDGASLNRLAVSATVHCLTGCAIGEVLGMVIGTALGWSNWPTVALAVVLAFVFGYALTLWPLRRAGIAWGTALGLAFASDTLAIPGAMDAGLTDFLFWGSLAASLIVAGVAAFPVNRWLIAQGKGHAVVHAHHGH